MRRLPRSPCAHCGREMPRRETMCCSRACIGALRRAESPQETTADVARELFDYDPQTGRLFRRETRWIPRAHGWIDQGYLVIRAGGQSKYMAHRVAWLIVHGEWPSAEIDHINGNRLDNRIANLRDVTKATNRENLRKATASSSSGLLGAFRETATSWYSEIRTKGQRYRLGTFASPEEAHAAYVAAKRLLHKGNTL